MKLFGFVFVLVAMIVIGVNTASSACLPNNDNNTTIIATTVSPPAISSTTITNAGYVPSPPTVSSNFIVVTGIVENYSVLLNSASPPAYCSGNAPELFNNPFEVVKARVAGFYPVTKFPQELNSISNAEWLKTMLKSRNT